ncbi:SufE family protein [Granulibacter bethesdensis]|uniref:SufE protein n=1 Tax=Granulibacter bethesdensis (strain ATCC BAA-1260 / CGDNIH1) TaxID=391165 RepID=Q0BPW6_GRABC|nr:SufE family protein [Granulibacter bethesdensis]ABI63136.1 SufE protein [Granulibacter bethesdensis CGDNIH1]AHJ67894.1 SufE protein [Granulibacter bethesdensis]APH53012.1 SufE protein [Granulibacter bethesdensis]APH65700.1 SufE protein [Granulibacter bethesdensis]
MTDDPFYHPQEDSAEAAIEAIADELSVFDEDWDRYQFIIDMGKTLPPFPADWMNDAHKVPGCQSQVWMEARVENVALYLAGKSDALIVGGLIALLLRVYSGRTPAEILATDPVWLKTLGLTGSLSINRGSGLEAMARKIHELAASVRTQSGT